MRLINVHDGSFKEFIGRNVPPYAILSHTWEEEEVSYKDVIENRHREKKGFDKVEMTCKIAASEGIEWVWVDTCCMYFFFWKIDTNLRSMPGKDRFNSETQVS